MPASKRWQEQQGLAKRQQGQEVEVEGDDDGDGDDNGQPLHVSYADKFEAMDVDPEYGECYKLSRKINSFVVYYIGAYVCNIDLGAKRPVAAAAAAAAADQPGSKFTSAVKSRHGRSQRRGCMGAIKQSEWSRNLRFGWCPRAVMLVLSMLSIYLHIAAYHQYVYDFDLLRLLRLQRNRAWSNFGQSSEHLLEESSAVIARMNATSATMNLLGSNYSNLPILIECLYLLVATRVGIYLFLYAYYRFNSFLDCHLVRDALYGKHEGDNIKRMVKRQVSKFLQSCRVHHYGGDLMMMMMLIQTDATSSSPNTNTCTEFSDDESEAEAEADVGSKTEIIVTPANGANVSSDGGGGRNTCESERVFEMVREMLAHNSLAPLYKMRDWAEERTILQAKNHLIFTIYPILFDASIAYGLSTLSSSAKFGQQTAHSHFVQLVCFILLNTTTPAVLLHGGLFRTVVADQIKYVEQLSSMIRLCIEQNSRNFALILKYSRRNQLPVSSTSSSRIRSRSLQVKGQAKRGDRRGAADAPEEDERDGRRRLSRRLARARAAMNSNLIFTLLHYKIFVAQLAPIKRSLGFFNVLAHILLFATPIIARFHEPYVGQVSLGKLSGAEIKIFAVAISASVMLPHNIVCWPLCVMLTRCKGLYKELSSLLAHTSEVRSYQIGEHLYDSHAEICLIKELSDPAKLLEQLTVSFGGIEATHTAFMKALFWYGLILISIMADGNNAHDGQDLFGWFFSDPLRVFS